MSTAGSWVMPTPACRRPMVQFELLAVARFEGQLIAGNAFDGAATRRRRRRLLADCVEDDATTIATATSGRVSVER